MVSTSSIQRFSTSRPDLYAFNVTGTVTSEDMSAMAKVMQNAFSQHEKVDMLLYFDDYEGSEFGAGMSAETIDAQISALSSVRRYVVANAPQSAKWAIDLFDMVVPVQAESFETKQAALRALDACETA